MKVGCITMCEPHIINTLEKTKGNLDARLAGKSELEVSQTIQERTGFFRKIKKAFIPVFACAVIAVCTPNYTYGQEIKCEGGKNITITTHRRVSQDELISPENDKKATAAILYKMATGLYQERRFDHSERLIKDVLKLQPNNVDYNMFYYSNFKIPEEGIKRFKELEKNIQSYSIEDQIKLHFSLGGFYSIMSNFEQTYIQYKKAYKLDKNNSTSKQNYFWIKQKLNKN